MATSDRSESLLEQKTTLEGDAERPRDGPGVAHDVDKNRPRRDAGEERHGQKRVRRLFEEDPRVRDAGYLRSHRAKIVQQRRGGAEEPAGTCTHGVPVAGQRHALDNVVIPVDRQFFFLFVKKRRYEIIDIARIKARRISREPASDIGKA